MSNAAVIIGRRDPVYVGVRISTRAEWREGFWNVDNGLVPVKITLPCGGHATYNARADIPLVDVPCPCGDPRHWLIKYEDVPA